MGWVKLDDKRALNAKLVTAGFAARGLDEAALCMVASDETDGFLSDNRLLTLGAAHHQRNIHKLAQVLVDVGRWTRDDGTNGYWLVNYLEFNETRADAKARREERARAGRKGGLHSGASRKDTSGAGHNQATGEATASAKGEAVGFDNDEPRPDPTRPDPTPFVTPQQRGTQIPDTFVVSDAMRAWAQDKCPSVDVDQETEQMIDHYRGKGEVRKDWVATWRTWMRNAVKYQEQRRGGQPYSKSGYLVAGNPV